MCCFNLLGAVFVGHFLRQFNKDKVMIQESKQYKNECGNCVFAQMEDTYVIVYADFSAKSFEVETLLPVDVTDWEYVFLTTHVCVNVNRLLL